MTPDELIAQAFRALTGEPTPTVSMDPKLLGQYFAPMLNDPTPPPVTPQAAQALPTYSQPPPAQTFMGLTPNDWMQLIGVVGGNLQIGTPDQRARGVGFRPFTALGLGAQKYAQRDALTNEQARRQALAASIRQSNETIANSTNPADMERAWQLGVGNIGSLVPEAMTSGTGQQQKIPGGVTTRSELAFLPKPDTQSLWDQLAADSVARAFRLAAEDKKPADFSHLLNLAAKSPEMLKVLTNPQALEQWRNQLGLAGPAGFQNQEDAIRQAAVDASIPPEQRQWMASTVSTGPEGTKREYREAPTPDAVQAKSAQRLPNASNPQAIKDYFSTAEEQARAALSAGQATPGNRDLLKTLHPQTVPSAVNELTWRVINGNATQRDYSAWDRLHPSPEDKEQAKADARAEKAAKALKPETEMLIQGYEEELRDKYSKVGKSVPATGLRGYFVGPTTTTQADVDAKVELMLNDVKTAAERGAIREAKRRVKGSMQETQAQPSLVGQQATLSDGTPLPDGDRQLKDGRKVSVKGGIVQRMLP